MQKVIETLNKEGLIYKTKNEKISEMNQEDVFSEPARKHPLKYAWDISISDDKIDRRNNCSEGSYSDNIAVSNTPSRNDQCLPPEKKMQPGSTPIHTILINDDGPLRSKSPSIDMVDLPIVTPVKNAGSGDESSDDSFDSLRTICRKAIEKEKEKPEEKGRGKRKRRMPARYRSPLVGPKSKLRRMNDSSTRKSELETYFIQALHCSIYHI